MTLRPLAMAALVAGLLVTGLAGFTGTTDDTGLWRSVAERAAWERLVHWASADPNRADAGLAAQLEGASPADRVRLESARAALARADHGRFYAQIQSLRADTDESLRQVYLSKQAAYTRARMLLIVGLALALLGAGGLARAPTAQVLPPAPVAMEAVLRQRLEQLYATRLQAFENDRYAAYGELAAGLHHGLKTPLSSVRAAAQVAQLKVGPDHPARTQLDDIITEVDGLVDQIRLFLKAAGCGASTHVDIPAEQIVRNLDKTYAEEAQRRGVRWSCSVDTGGVEVAADATLLDMALRNIVENAIDASPAGSTIALVAKPCEAPTRAGLDGTASTSGAWIELAISDQGPGIPKSVLDGRATTSKPKGSGLGIALARRIVQRHGGALAIDTGPRQGTTVRVMLPAAHSRVKAA